MTESSIPSNAAPLALVIEHEPELRRFLCATLTANGFLVMTDATDDGGLPDLLTHSPTIVLLDLDSPQCVDGFEVMKQVRRWGYVPIVAISARARETDKIAALDGGADDYMTKPFGIGELLARLRVAVRHAATRGRPSATAIVDAGHLQIDFAARRTTVRAREIHLTPTEYKLLSALARNLGRVVPHHHILREVWGPPHANKTQYLRIYIAQLRKKIEENPARPHYLVTVPGVGYRLESI